MKKAARVVVAVTGASGSVYARGLIEGLLAAGEESVEKIGLVVSRRGGEVAVWEGIEFPNDPRIERFDNDDMFSSPASGSARWDAMVVVPCSMGCVGRIAAGVSSDLIARAADVMLKEGRPLVVVPRETPLSLIHLRNLTTLAQAGAVVMPASPSFYSRPATIRELCATVTDRVLARLGIPHDGHEWGATKS
ncbi:MAG: UbiX family flavin prenyltransferase [Alistipes sp.]|jgi:4-hydroxy-3-polyprenylbenzoate decarboxylase|nr:UbiX family flavin prenyltransferase [Alistipes sp.]